MLENGITQEEVEKKRLERDATAIKLRDLNDLLGAEDLKEKLTKNLIIFYTAERNHVMELLHIQTQQYELLNHEYIKRNSNNN